MTESKKDAHHCGESRRLALTLKEKDALIEKQIKIIQGWKDRLEEFVGPHKTLEGYQKAWEALHDESKAEILRLRGLLERAVKLAETPDDEWNRDLKEELISIKMELLGGGND